MSQSPISPLFFGDAFATAARAAEACGVDIVGPPFGFYPETPTETVRIEAGFPVSAPATTVGDAHPLVLPGGRVVQAVHVGPFETMETTYSELEAWMTEQHLEPSTGMWECYLSDPGSEPDQARWQTLIVWPIS